MCAFFVFVVLFYVNNGCLVEQNVWRNRGGQGFGVRIKL